MKTTGKSKLTILFVLCLLSWISLYANNKSSNKSQSGLWPTHIDNLPKKSNIVSWTAFNGIEWRVLVPKGGFPNRLHNIIYVTKISGDGSGIYSHSIIEFNVVDEHRLYRTLEENYYSKSGKLLKSARRGSWIDTGSSNSSRSMDPMYDFITTSIAAYDYNKLTFKQYNSNPPTNQNVIDFLVMIGNSNAIKNNK